MKSIIRKKFVALLTSLVVVLIAALVFAGGPLATFSPGTPFLWGLGGFTTLPGGVPYLKDMGDLDPGGVLVPKAAADALTDLSASEISAVPTSIFTLADSGDIGFDVTGATASTYLFTFHGAFIDVLYDEDSSIMAAFGAPGALGLGGFIFTSGQEIVSGLAIMNGPTVAAGDVGGTFFRIVFAQEVAHALNLHHDQTNGAISFFGDNNAPGGSLASPVCPSLATVPAFADFTALYPFASISVGGPGAEAASFDHLEDMSSLSRLYPTGTYASSTGTITGTVFASNGVTPVNGVNVIARNTADPFGDARSTITGDLEFAPGDGFAGTFVLTGLTPGADYTLAIDNQVAGSFAQPPPGQFIEEFWNGGSESADPDLDDPCDFVTISAVAGVTATADIIINVPPPLPPIPPALPSVCYASTGFADGGNLLTIDPLTGVGTLIGATGLAGVPGLAINSRGEIFGTESGGGGALFRIDAATGAAFSVAGTGIPFLDAIAFDENDVLYAVGFDPPSFNLRIIDTQDGTSTIVGPIGDIITGLAFDPTTGDLYGSTGGFFPVVADGIYKIDKTTGAATLLGTTGFGGATPDLMFDSAGNLFGSKGGGGGANNLISINKSTGAGTVVGPTGFRAVSGLACNRQVGVAIDIIPRHCPNILHIERDDVISVVIVGTDTLDVSTIDPESVRLEGIAPIGGRDKQQKDITRPVVDRQEVCDCTADGPDGIPDLSFRFSISELRDRLGELDPVDEPQVVINLTGKLNDGTPIGGADCVFIIRGAGNAAKGISDIGSIPEDYALAQNYPNPFNPSTTITFALPEAGEINLAIYNLRGQLVRTLVSGALTAGRHQVVWDSTADNGAGVASGIYIYRLQAKNFVADRKLVLLK